MASKTNGLNGVNGGGHSSASGSSSASKPSYVPNPPEPKVEKPVQPAKANREGIESTFARFGQFVEDGKSPRPGQYGGDTMASVRNKGKLSNDLKHLTLDNVKTVLKIAKSKIKGEMLVDDKTMIMEKTIQIVAGLPSHSRLREELTNTFLNELWYTLDHPPMLYLGDEYKYRNPTGYNNNPIFPSMGAAGSNYARTCRAGVVQPGALPDPSLIFESIMKRTSYRPHPNNVSSILWYWATIIIHDLFWTDHMKPETTKTSSYLDLSPLYGSNQEMQDSIRTFKDGMMKPDTYADKRLHGMPPGCSVILFMFNRFHNYTAKNLAAINEHGRFTPPDKMKLPPGHPPLEGEALAKAWKKYDNDLFQTARLITNGLYINITLVDYVRNIVNLNRSNTTWTLDPRQEMGKNAGTNTGAERGNGSAVSAEFNLCYRWHSCISAKDAEWTAQFFEEVMGKKPTEVETMDMMMGFKKFEMSIPDEPSERTFGGYKRREDDGSFEDDDLVNCISDAIEDCAGSFGGRHVPEAMKPVEILGILQGRKWQVAGLNEFRKHFGLKPFESMEEINSDPEIAESLQHLYGHPDFVELYPGLVAEEAKAPMVPGVGIAPTYTISRVILSDAVCLTRGDRFYTTDYNPRSLTNWGYNEVAYDLDLNQGCCFYKLFIRAFPNHFSYNSAYAHYPMCVPSETQKIMTNLGRVQDFDFTRPKTYGVDNAKSVTVTSASLATHVLSSSSSSFPAIHPSSAAYLTSIPGGPSSLSANPPLSGTLSALPGNFAETAKSFFSKTTASLLSSASYKLAGATHVDLVRDVLNAVPVHFVSELLSIPLKDESDSKSKGTYTSSELYTVLALAYSILYHDIDPVKAFPLRMAARDLLSQFGSLLEGSVKKASGGKSEVGKLGGETIKAIKSAGGAGKKADNKQVAFGEVLPLAALLGPSLGEIVASAVDWYLTPSGGSKHVGEVQEAASREVGSESDALVLGYLLEGLRMSGSFGVVREAGPGGDELTGAKEGVKVFLPSAAASQDAAVFPNPESVDPRRPVNSYVHFNLAPINALGETEGSVAKACLVEMFRAVFRLKNLKRTPGEQGMLRKVARVGEFDNYLRDDGGSYFPFPCTMRVSFDS